MVASTLGLRSVAMLVDANDCILAEGIFKK